MLKTYQKIKPNVSPSAFIAETAVLIGDVRVGPYASIWYNTVIRADLTRIEIGAYSNIQDGTVIHLEKDHPCIIGEYVTVGHMAMLHGCEIEDDCLIGMNAVILTGAKIGKGSIIAAGALIPEGKIIPEKSLVMGMPGKIIRKVTDDDFSGHQGALNYVGYMKSYQTKNGKKK
jgi:carbonic anhydrase/acetyltransferase-like protein (isoleucine patch superfamily)